MRPWTETRDYTRLPIGEECTVEFGDQVVRGRIDNVSLGGAYICAGKLPELDSQVTLSAENMHSITGTVVRRGADGFALRFEPSEAKVVGVGDVMTKAVNSELLAQD